MSALSSSLSEILIKNHNQQPIQKSWLNKVPHITLAFWVIKIMSTTVGETVAEILKRIKPMQNFKKSYEISATFSQSTITKLLVGTLTLSTLAFGIVGCDKNTANSANPASPTATSSGSANHATVSKLGDLTPFSSIAVDVNKRVEQGNLPQAKTRIKDLEMAWDSAEAGLKPRSADDWHKVDEGIDKALSALRADTPNQANCKTAMANLLTTFNQLQPK